MTSGVALIALAIGELSSLWQRSLGRVCTRALWRHNSCIWRSTETAIGGAPRHRSQPKLLDGRGGGAFAKHNPRWTLKVISLLTQRPMDASLNAKKIARDVQRICSMLSVYM